MKLAGEASEFKMAAGWPVGGYEFNMASWAPTSEIPKNGPFVKLGTGEPADALNAST